jgi:hypothetical protein
MDVNTFNNPKQLNATTKIVEEYRDLIRLSSPSDEQLDRIEEILESAIANTQLAEFLNKVDEKLALEINLSGGELEINLSGAKLRTIHFSGHECNSNENLEVLSDHNFQPIQEFFSQNDESFYSSIKNTRGSKSGQQVRENSNLIKFPRSEILHSHENSLGHNSGERLSHNLSDNESISLKNQEQDLKTNSHISQKKKWGWRDNIKPISYLVGGFFVLLTAPGLCNILNSIKGEVGNRYHNSSVMSSFQQDARDTTIELMNEREAKVSICNPDSDNVSEQMQEYYALYSKLEEDVTNQTLKPLEIKMQVQHLQKRAEIEQKQLEVEQRYAEIEKRKAEQQKSYDVAQKWKDKASNSLVQSRQWLCFSQHALTLIR